MKHVSHFASPHLLPPPAPDAHACSKLSLQTRQGASHYCIHCNIQLISHPICPRRAGCFMGSWLVFPSRPLHYMQNRSQHTYPMTFFLNTYIFSRTSSQTASLGTAQSCFQTETFENQTTVTISQIRSGLDWHPLLFERFIILAGSHLQATVQYGLFSSCIPIVFTVYQSYKLLLLR